MIHISLETLSKNISKIAFSCINDDEVINVSTSEGNVIMMSEKRYRSLIESLTLAGIPGMQESIAEGINTPLENCEKVEWE